MTQTPHAYVLGIDVIGSPSKIPAIGFATFEEAEVTLQTILAKGYYSPSPEILFFTGPGTAYRVAPVKILETPESPPDLSGKTLMCIFNGAMLAFHFDDVSELERCMDKVREERLIRYVRSDEEVTYVQLAPGCSVAQMDTSTYIEQQRQARLAQQQRTSRLVVPSRP